MHQPVLLDEILKSFPIKKEGIIVDATIGLGGHSWAILANSPPGLKIIGIDLDAHALKIAWDRLKVYKDRLTLFQENFRNLDSVLKNLNINKIDGLLFDLGVSSLQLDTPERGFSFQSEAKLDMRFDTREETTAADLVNSLKLDELEYILREFGEERFAARIAKSIIEYRKKEPISTTGQLVKIIFKSLSPKRHYQKIHPATRTFQALRIYLNQELVALKEAVEKGIFFLNSGGRIGVISFHSGEDRVVKQLFRKFAQEKVLKIINKKPLSPQEQEISLNPRSRSAKLRLAERLE
jgi:16S rRNA (cytosine1402-N4)-methyltransferase